MKKLILATLLFALPYIASAQTVPAAQLIFSTVADLRLQVGTDNSIATLNGLTAKNDGNGGIYMWNATSTTADDGFINIQVTGVTTGRWVRIGNGNTIKGSVTFSGLALTTSYAVNYPQGTLPFVPITVLVIPRSANAAALSYIPSGGITNTGFTINFLTVPVLGTNNISFDFVVIKQ